jgi:hypothetical protein
MVVSRYWAACRGLNMGTNGPNGTIGPCRTGFFSYEFSRMEKLVRQGPFSPFVPSRSPPSAKFRANHIVDS